MKNAVIRHAAPADHEAVCALNLAAVQHTSAMDATRLAVLASLGCYFKVACVEENVAAFLIAMCNGTPYENDNFVWFDRKYARFVYVDRIVVSSAFRGMRLGSLLYEDLFCYARDRSIPLLACEYNIVPLNEPSRSFHDKFGFKEQGRQWVANGTKQVSLQVADLTHANPNYRV